MTLIITVAETNGMPLQLGVLALVAVIVGGIAALDAARRGRSWLASGVSVGVVAFVALVGISAGDGSLLSAYTVLTGHPLSISAPAELLVVRLGAIAVIAGGVLLGYGVVSRHRHAA